MIAIKICALALTLGFAAMMISSTSSSAFASSRSTAWAQQSQQSPTPQQATPQQPPTPEQATPQQQNPDQAVPQEAEPNGQQQQEPTAQLFAGKITEQNGEYVLYVPSSRTTYKLDDQSKAKQFNGQDVKVQGVLDASSNTIKVADIQAASASQ